MEEPQRIEQLEVLKEKLRARCPNAQDVGCHLCRWILEDLEKNGTLTNKHPEPCVDGKPHFPVEGKVKHLILEGFLQRKAPPVPKA